MRINRGSYDGRDAVHAYLAFRKSELKNHLPILNK